MRVIAVVLAGAALLVACSNDPPPQGNSPPLVSTRPPTYAPSSPTPAVTPSETPTETPTVAISDTLCSRADQAALSRILKARRLTMRSDVTPLFGVPTYDVCAFTVTPASGKPYTLRVGASVLPATAADLATARRTYDVTRGRSERSRTAAAGQGGYGTSRFVVFLGSGRLVLVSGPASYAQNLAVAREMAKQTAGLPAAPTEITRPECERAGAAAAKVLGAPPTIRRDRVNQYGDTECGWAIATRTISSTATRVRNAAQVFEVNARRPGAEPVPLGDDGLYDPGTHAVQVRIGADRIATFAPVPTGQAAKNDVIAFALRLSGLYTR
jgi:hypothetical protein